MPDTTVRVEYIGAVQNFSEVTLTGNQQVWRIGTSAHVESSRAAQLVASGKFRTLSNAPAQLPADSVPVTATPSVMGNTFSAGGAEISSDLKKSIRQVATRSFVGHQLTAGTKQCMSRTTHYNYEYLSAIKLIFPTWYVTGNVGEVPCTSPLTLRASIEQDDGTITQITFAGQTTAQSSADFIESDWMPVAMKPGRFRVRTWQSSEWGAVSSLFPSAASNTSWGDFCNVGTTSTDLTAGGAITNNVSGAAYFPCAILGLGSLPATYMIGDSRVVGATDGTPDGAMNHGDISRYVGRRWPYINGARGGDTATSAATMTRRAALAVYCQRSIVGYGINDLITRAMTPGAIQTSLQGVLAALPINHDKRILTVSPVSTSTDSWATTGNQTTHSTNANRVSLNAIIRMNQVVGQNGYIEVADFVESARDSGIWQAGYTSDGTHANVTADSAIELGQARYL